MDCWNWLWLSPLHTCPEPPEKLLLDSYSISGQLAFSACAGIHAWPLYSKAGQLYRSIPKQLTEVFLWLYCNFSSSFVPPYFFSLSPSSWSIFPMNFLCVTLCFKVYFLWNLTQDKVPEVVVWGSRLYRGILELGYQASWLAGNENLTVMIVGGTLYLQITHCIFR